RRTRARPPCVHLRPIVIGVPVAFSLVAASTRELGCPPADSVEKSADDPADSVEKSADDPADSVEKSADDPADSAENSPRGDRTERPPLVRSLVELADQRER